MSENRPRAQRAKTPDGATPEKPVQVRSDDVQMQSDTTSATAKLNNLVTGAVLMPDQEDVVLATEAELNMAYAEALRFNEEPVTIRIHEDQSEHPIDPVPLSVNGKQIFLKRGVDYTIPRKFVECLMNPLAHIKTKQKKNNLGEDETEIESTKAYQFPFSIVEDQNPKGRAWLTQLRNRG